MWNQGTQLAILAGAGAAILGLAVIAWALLSYSKRLPIGKFFRYSAGLIAVLSVVLTGKGVSALQEAGLLDIHPLAGVPQIELLGVFPTIEGLCAQLVAALVISAGFWVSTTRARTIT
jgi:high-affinity iron transporter